MSRPRFRTRRTEDPGQDPHWQDVQSQASWFHLRPIPYKRDPHDKSPPRMRSLLLAQPAPDFDWCMGHCTRREHHHCTTDACGVAIPHAMQIQQLAAMQAADPDKSLNAGLTGCAAVPSPSSPTLPHTSSTRGTQAPPTTSSGLDLGSSVVG
jgi:hypothetical protein